MSGQKSEFPVTLDGAVVGSLSVFRQGPFTVFDCTCRSSERDVLRLAAVCGGKYVPIGVMVPGGGELRLKKSLSKNALAEAGYSPTTLFRLVRQDELQKGPCEPSSPPEAAPGPFAVGIPAGGGLPESSAPEAFAPADDAHGGQRGAADAPLAAGAREGKPSGEEKALSLPEEVLPAANPPGQAAGGNAQHSDVLETAEASSAAKLEALSKLPEGSDAIAPGDAQETGGSSAGKGETEDCGAVSGGASEEGPPPETASPDGFSPVCDAGALFADPEVREACAGVRGAIATRDGDLVLLAVPLSADEPFPMMPVFCFGSYAEIGGRAYIVFKIKNGYLTL